MLVSRNRVLFDATSLCLLFVVFLSTSCLAQVSDSTCQQQDSKMTASPPIQDTTTTTTAHSAAAIALSKKESAEHLEKLGGLYEHLRRKQLWVKAYKLEDDNDVPDDKNTKTIHFVRHGQGFHNLMADMYQQQNIEWEQYTHTKENPYILPELLDAPLTEKGRQQAYQLQQQTVQQQVELVVMSPNCRALQTGVIAFEHLIGKVPFVAHEMAREETGVHACDQRRLKSRQEKEFPMVNFDLLTSEEDPLFRSDRRETKLELAARIYAFFEWLSQRPEQHIAVNSHSGWLFTIFNAFIDCSEELKPWFQTGEMRSVKLEFIQNPNGATEEK